jgi:hypothetical protein
MLFRAYFYQSDTIYLKKLQRHRYQEMLNTTLIVLKGQSHEKVGELEVWGVSLLC